LRTEVKDRLRNSTALERAALDSTQLTLKIMANTMSYGNFVELNVEDLSRPQRRSLYGFSGKVQTISTNKSEEPGRYFHPLVAPMIAGGAGLMLAMTERLVLGRGLDWGFCDTDSMAIAKPLNMDDGVFSAKVEEIRGCFEPLNPYFQPGSILKME